MRRSARGATTWTSRAGSSRGPRKGMIGQKLADRYEITRRAGPRRHGRRLPRPRPAAQPRGRGQADPARAPQRPTAEQRFQREAQLVAQMDHPAIVPIYDFGRHEGSLFFVMPLVAGHEPARVPAPGLAAPRRRPRHRHPGRRGARLQPRARRRPPRHQAREHHGRRARRARGVRVRVMDFGLARAATESRLTKTGHARRARSPT